LGSGSGVGLAVLGTEALTACSWAACAADDTARFAVWASAMKSEEECEPTCHAAPAKKRQEIPVMMRIDERRKRSSAKTYLVAIVAASYAGC
jgi:hypothetical protein